MRLKKIFTSLLLSLVIFNSFAFFGRIDFTIGDENFSDDSLVRGVQATRAQCDTVVGAVWAATDLTAGECLRYWHSGLKTDSNSIALFFFQGDLLAGNKVLDDKYSSLNPTKMQMGVDSVSNRLSIPYLFLARPGMHGSSGEHKQRRRGLESKLISAAIDEIKKRHRIEKIAVAGQSGGGHVVASLLGYRSDIVCAVPTSGVTSPKMRWSQKGRATDTTGYSDSYEPTLNLVANKMNADLRVFVLGDPQDSNVPWNTQTVLVDRLKAISVKVEILEGEGRGSERHGLSNSAILIGAMCARGITTELILKRASQGLKG